MNFKIELSKLAKKDYDKIKKSPLRGKLLKLLSILEANPYEQPYEALSHNLIGMFSRRINLQHRLVYQVFDDTKTVYILRMWTHYDSI